MNDIHLPQMVTLYIDMDILFPFLFRQLREDNSFHEDNLHFERPNSTESFHIYIGIFNWDTNYYLNLQHLQ